MYTILYCFTVTLVSDSENIVKHRFVVLYFYGKIVKNMWKKCFFSIFVYSYYSDWKHIDVDVDVLVFEAAENRSSGEYRDINADLIYVFM